ncbi:hypothetical protein C7974DRAFT_425421 [Boeremia exigua]|uniref:uncharacterized protein n=1 Tax=Boeremia exigua TaxID=749465 RepID=UPI001E8E367F|nr:uncharacterized protein C7974DRAFT_425421 [Boeremia exigua]KAH6625820.1 hypothetical protein C7974DRAFT_425421 [Boeremia exigua]
MASHKDKANNKPARKMGKKTEKRKYSGNGKQTNDRVIIAMLERQIKKAQKLEKENAAMLERQIKKAQKLEKKNAAMLRVVRKHYKMKKKKERAASQAVKKLYRDHCPDILQRNQQELTASPELVMNTTDLISEATGPAPEESFSSETQSLQSGPDDSATVSEEDHKGGSEALARDDAYDDNEEDDTSSLRDDRLKYYAFNTPCSDAVLSRVATALVKEHKLTERPSNALLSEIRSFGQTLEKQHPNRVFWAPSYLAFRKLHTLNTARTEERRPTTFKYTGLASIVEHARKSADDFMVVLKDYEKNHMKDGQEKKSSA